MAEFQWWLLLVGLVAGGAIVSVVSMDAKRERADIEAREREAMASWIADRLAKDGVDVDTDRVAAVIAAEQDYLALPPPDELLPEDAPALER
jgi:hypothetical protein